MSKLSPAAQAVLDAANDAYWSTEEMCPNDAEVIAAAALRAAADQMGYYSGYNLSDELEVMYSEGWNHCLKQILAIADELDAI